MANNVTSQIKIENAPALLVSFAYLNNFLKHRSKYEFRDWVLDSGAFSAFNSGIEINLNDYIAVCKDLLVNDEKLTEVFALDVIGDWKASLKNTEQMWKEGIEAIPCYHYGEPEFVLKTLARDYPKIALGGVAAQSPQIKLCWAKQCFARVYPKKIHGFAFGTQKAILALPWHSVDATTWKVGPSKFGRWNSFGRIRTRGSKQNLRAEVEFYLKLEYKARMLWANEMRRLEDNNNNTMSVRLAVTGQATKQIISAFSMPQNPTVRLATCDVYHISKERVSIR